MRASRLLSILMLLQARGRVSATELADHVEVSVRTIYRDVEQLSAAGIPVYAERGRTGGFRLLEGWRTRLTGLTEAEAQAIFLAGLPGPAGDLGLGEAVATAERKLAAALPAGWQADAQRVSTRVHLDTVGWYQTSDRVEHLTTIAAAVWSDEVVAVRYESWSGVTERELHPLGLVIKAGAWYVVATRSGGGPPRTYRVSNVLAAEPTGRHFRRPSRFDLRAHWEASTRDFEQALQRGRAVLLATEQGVERLRRMNGALAAAVSSAPPPGGRRAPARRRVVIPIESLDHATGMLLGLGADVEVVEPAELRDALATAARAVATLYA